MPWYTILCLTVFGLTTVLHLIFCLNGMRLARSITKGLLLPLIMACYLLLAPTPSPLVLLAQTFGWLGDLLLLSKRKRNFILGACSFFLGHGFYIAAMLMTSVRGRPPGLAVLILIFLSVPVAAALLFRKELAKDPVMKATPLYFAMLGALGLTAAGALYSDACPATACLLSGALLFLLSDTILVTLMLKKTRAASYGSFWVMLTYIAAQALLAAGFIL